MSKDTPAGTRPPGQPPGWHNRAPDWYRDGRDHVWHPYTQMQDASPPLPVVSTEGVHMTLADGRRLIDGIGSWWTACHGYNHPHIVAAMEKQLAAMPHVMFGGLAHEPGYRLASRLAGLLPGDLNHVFFADSGSVSVEIALKMALQYWRNKGREGRRRILSFSNGYHGDTWGAMAVTDPGQGMHGPFAELFGEPLIVDMPTAPGSLQSFDRLLASEASSLAAIIVEPLVQGAGGMKFHRPEILRAIAGTARRHEVLLIADEIFTGFGRTGHMFACEGAEIVPDIMCLGKGLTGGVISLAATVARDHIYEAFLSDDPARALMHGPTYMANPLACAAAAASLDLFGDGARLDQARSIESGLRAGLEPCRGLDHVTDVRAMGAIGVVELARLDHLDWLRDALVDQGVWLRPFGNIVYLTPALTIGAEDLATLTGAVCRVMAEWDRRGR